jgi:prophage regulatory protein
VGWPDFEVDSICKARIAGKSEDDIRALVIYLEAARLELGGSE